MFVKIGRISTSLRKRLENDFGRKMFAPRGTRVVVSLTTRGIITHSISARATRYKNTRPDCTKMKLHRFPCIWKVFKLYGIVYLSEAKNRCVVNKIVIHPRMINRIPNQLGEIVSTIFFFVPHFIEKSFLKFLEERKKKETWRKNRTWRWWYKLLNIPPIHDNILPD